MQKSPDLVLKRYSAILRSEAEAKYLALKRSRNLAERAASAYKILDSCVLCEHRCKANRTAGQQGKCRVSGLRISSAFMHLGEEPFLVPSWTVFFAGCNLRCVYCQNWEISQKQQGQEISVEGLAGLFQQAKGCRNINLVGGSPTPFLPWILDALNRVELNIPIVWNSNFYMSLEAMELLKGLVDVYLSDWKYGNNKCAERLSGVKNYFDVVERNHSMAFADSELVIRHLALPNHFECCTAPILKRIAELFGARVVVNVMEQYRPEYKAFGFEGIGRRLSHGEYIRATELAEQLGLPQQ